MGKPLDVTVVIAAKDEEATIADVHRAILARQVTATQLVNDYLKRIAAYNGTCVKGAVDPATEVRLQTALEGVTSGRTSVAIACGSLR